MSKNHTEATTHPTHHRSLRWLWERARQIGIDLVSPYDRTAVEKSLAQSDDDGHARPTHRRYWDFLSRYVGTGAVEAVDPDGWWTASVHPDGGARITYHTAPNLHNRVPGTQYADAVLDVPSLAEFVARLGILASEADDIFDETAAEIHAEDRRLARALRSEEDTEPTAGEDRRISKMRSMSAEFGLVGVNAPSNDLLPFKLAEALGIDAYTENDLEVRPWNELADDVLRHGLPKPIPVPVVTATPPAFETTGPMVVIDREQNPRDVFLDAFGNSTAIVVPVPTPTDAERMAGLVVDDPVAHEVANVPEDKPGDPVPGAPAITIPDQVPLWAIERPGNPTVYWNVPSHGWTIRDRATTWAEAGAAETVRQSMKQKGTYGVVNLRPAITPVPALATVWVIQKEGKTLGARTFWSTEEKGWVSQSNATTWTNFEGANEFRLSLSVHERQGVSTVAIPARP